MPQNTKDTLQSLILHGTFPSFHKYHMGIKFTEQFFCCKTVIDYSVEKSFTLQQCSNEYLFLKLLRKSFRWY